MTLQKFLTTAILLLSAALTACAYPQAKDLAEAEMLRPRALSGAVQHTSTLTNLTRTSPLLPSTTIGVIRCFGLDHGRLPTDVEGCRPTLNYLRSFPDYRRIQDFKEGRWPKIPSKPPYAVHHTQSTCAVQIASGDPATVDAFSFEQARALALEILEVCKDHGGFGGVAPIGRGVGWSVAVVGFGILPPPEQADMMQAGSGNGTAVAVSVVEA